MKMNNKMSDLLQKGALEWPLAAEASTGDLPRVEIVYDCVLLKSEYERNKHVKIADFPDKTGFESFINHVHLSYPRTNESLISCLKYATTLKDALIPLTHDRRFRVIVSLSQDAPSDRFGCTVRFHQIRSDENWISEDLEGYESEAILVFDVPS
jgi:hypothetical protein